MAENNSTQDKSRHTQDSLEGISNMRSSKPKNKEKPKETKKDQKR